MREHLALRSRPRPPARPGQDRCGDCAWRAILLLIEPGSKVAGRPDGAACRHFVRSAEAVN